MATRLPQMLRADAEENRELVLDAARALFSERGLDVPLREVARRAGVGPATLYRRFPTKQALIDEIFTDELRACRAIVDEECADPDPWRGFCAVLCRVGELNAMNQRFIDAFLSTDARSIDLDAHRAALLGSLAELSRRAQRAGKLRADFVLDDLVLFLAAARGLPGGSVQQRLAGARRFAELAIDAFRA
ncbi:helix-turn-helix domain-containing protein [Subtercola sp. RTI3]|uniref:TetR/AcrR family transcriptional regulator n=1 Tax=Subtercola sp. RTI3 TaxID=3048639 RepID=UPI002B23C14E|nr:helix-turn-helix domain-containing protein [Subtercola sp. RTI3]MEA9986578.1 helix-turn-helix domain-containing protein [Subtercola sp. RTI3]